MDQGILFVPNAQADDSFTGDKLFPPLNNVHFYAGAPICMVVRYIRTCIGLCIQKYVCAL